ncbi:MAG: CPBP family glutamic-type intramembrane protease [Bacteroidales bacterium]
MKFKPFFLSIFFMGFSLLSGGDLSAQTPDHESFLRAMENSNEQVYKSSLKQFDDYLALHPDDVKGHIEKCKFIQFAQYDEEEDYNPNQESFDSCVASLSEMFPGHPEVLLFRLSYLWGDELKEIFTIARESVEENPERWSNENQGKLYSSIAQQHYQDEEYPMAQFYISKAISKDQKYQSSLLHARIMMEVNQEKKALEILLAMPDTTKECWELSQRADLLMNLKAYSAALEVYRLIDKIDSTFTNKNNLAKTLEGIGEYESARSCLLADTSREWDKESALEALLIHDLKYQEGDYCIATYNQFRDFGYMSDPLAIYRFRLFFSHPWQPWRFRDILGVISLLGLLLILILLPSIWILPVYFVGHHWKFLFREKPLQSNWGLRAFWFVSAGYLLASFFSSAADPEYLYSLVKSSYYPGLSQEKEGFISLLFILFSAFFGLAVFFRNKLKLLLGGQWSVGRSIFIALGIFIIYKGLLGLYIRLGMNQFGISPDNLTGIPDLFLSSRQDIRAILAIYGPFLSMILIALLVPLYEEIIFRGVILDAVHRYINFGSANTLQAALFAAVHQDLFLFPAFFLFGILTGRMRKNANGLLPAIVFHILNNILAMAALIVRR